MQKTCASVNRVEVELAKSEEGQARLDRSKDRIDHWAAKVGEEVLAEDAAIDNNERERTTGLFDKDTEMKQVEEFDISGSPEKAPEEEIELSSRGVVPSERRIGTPERAQATKRRPTNDSKSSPPKRLVVDPGDDMESDDDGTDGAMVGGDEMQFEEESPTGGGEATCSPH